MNTKRMFRPNMRQEYYAFHFVLFWTYEKVVYSLLGTYTADQELAYSNSALHDMNMTRTDTRTTFGSRLTKSSLRFGQVYTKAQLVQIFVGRLPENISCFVCQKIFDAPNIA